MHAVATILAKDARLRLRDRTVFVYGFLAPFVIAVVLGFVFGSVDEPLDLDLAVVAPPTSALSAPLVDGVLPPLVEDGLVASVQRMDDRDAAATAVDAAEADAGLVVLPDGPGGPGGIEVLSSVDSSVAGDVAAAIARDIVGGARATTAAVQGAVAVGASVSPAEVVAAGAAAGPVATVELAAVGTPPLDARTGVAVGIAVFFLLFAVGIASTGLLEEERDGTLARLRAAPIPVWSVLVAKALFGFAIGITSLTTLAVATTLVLGASWGDPVRLAAVFVAGSAAAVGIVAVIASLAATPEVASNGTAVVGTVAGALGGSFFPVAGGSLLGAVAAATPHKWFLDGVRATAGDAPLADVAVPVAVLLGMALVAGGVAAWRLRRRVGVA